MLTEIHQTQEIEYSVVALIGVKQCENKENDKGWTDRKRGWVSCNREVTPRERCGVGGGGIQKEDMPCTGNNHLS